MPTTLPAYHVTLPGPTFTIGTFREFPARNGYGYAATLLRDGEHVGSLFDDGDGSIAYAHWFDDTAQEQFLALADHFPPGAGSLDADLCVAALHSGQVEAWMIEEFTSHEHLRRSLDRTARTATAALPSGQRAADAWLKVKSAFDERVARYLTTTYGPGTQYWVTGRGWTAIAA